MKVNRPVLVVMGIMARSPFAGVAWQGLHYLEGFRRLGYDVYYFEDTGDWPYDVDLETVTADTSYPVNYIGRMLAWCGLSDRFSYRSGVDGQLYGMSTSEVAEVLEQAEILVNLTGSTLLREDHLQVPVRIYLETDPVLPQIEVAQGRQFTIDQLSLHTHHFTYGENLGTPACPLPLDRFTYQPTRQPVILDWWTSSSEAASDGPFTTISSWEQTGKDIEWEGETYYWSKHLEFLKVIDLPQRTQVPMALALANAGADAMTLLASYGWQVSDAIELSKDTLPYRDFIQQSRGEFTVAKDQNIRLSSGWFSDRSACYLAAGRPVITQDTGFGQVLPTGKGLFSWSTLEDSLAALDAIQCDYAGHCQAARDIASSYFAAERVLADLIDSL